MPDNVISGLTSNQPRTMRPFRSLNHPLLNNSMTWENAFALVIVAEKRSKIRQNPFQTTNSASP